MKNINRRYLWIALPVTALAIIAYRQHARRVQLEDEYA